MDARTTPDHRYRACPLPTPSDQLLHLGAEPRPTEPGSRPPGPIQSPTLPVPPQDGVRLDDSEVVPPASRPEAAKPNPEDSIMTTEARIWVGAQRDLELMAEDQVLEREIPTRSNGSNEGAKNQGK